MKVGELKINDKFIWRKTSDVVVVLDIKETTNERTLTPQCPNGNVIHPTFRKAFNVKTMGDSDALQPSNH